MLNNFSCLDAQRDVSAFAMLTPEDAADFNAWLDERHAELIAAIERDEQLTRDMAALAPVEPDLYPWEACYRFRCVALTVGCFYAIAGLLTWEPLFSDRS
jgi:hypothetical protein